MILIIIVWQCIATTAGRGYSMTVALTLLLLLLPLPLLLSCLSWGTGFCNQGYLWVRKDCVSGCAA
jgi:hypothetical protein